MLTLRYPAMAQAKLTPFGIIRILAIGGEFRGRAGCAPQAVSSAL